MKRLPEIIGPKIFLFLGLVDIVAALVIFLKLSTVRIMFDSMLVVAGSILFILLTYLMNYKIGLIATVLIIILNIINVPFAKFIGLVILLKGLATIAHYLKLCGYHRKNKYTEFTIG